MNKQQTCWNQSHSGPTNQHKEGGKRKGGRRKKKLPHTSGQQWTGVSEFHSRKWTSIQGSIPHVQNKAAGVVGEFFVLFCFEDLFAVVKPSRKKQVCPTCLADRVGFAQLLKVCRSKYDSEHFCGQFWGGKYRFQNKRVCKDKLLQISHCIENVFYQAPDFQKILEYKRGSGKRFIIIKDLLPKCCKAMDWCVKGRDCLYIVTSDSYQIYVAIKIHG